jgi:DNA-dependent RNA polymerase auxiliary subunit epsilon
MIEKRKYIIMFVVLILNKESKYEKQQTNYRIF